MKYVKKLPPSDIRLVGKKLERTTKITAKTITLTGFFLNQIPIPIGIKLESSV